LFPIFEDKGVILPRLYGNVYEARDEKELESVKRRIRDMSRLSHSGLPEEKLKLDQNPDSVQA